MNVAVHYKSQQRRLRSAVRDTVLGDGMLERVRSTSLALLGLTAAVGFAMVALALNQGWPLIAGVPLPNVEGEHQAIGKGAVVAEAATPSRGDAPGPTVTRQGRNVSARPASQGAQAAPAPAGSSPPGSAGILVSNSTPAGPSPAGAGKPSPTPAPASQEPAATTAPTAPPAPSSAPSAQPPAASASTPSSQPPASSAGAPAPASPEESDEDTDEDCPPEEEESDTEHDYPHGWDRGNGHGYGRR
jgi:hypothetical protein